MRVFVSRFKWSHRKKRRQYRKLYKAGAVKLVKRTRDGWLYKVEDE